MFGKAPPGTHRPGRNPMDRRVPSNPKYNGVQSKINSGTTIHKIQQISAKEYIKRRDEQYNRVGPISLYELFEEYEPKFDESVTGIVQENYGGPRIVTYSEQEEVHEDERPYLVLDIRSPQQYEAGHISAAINFPVMMLNQDRITPELYKFKNREDTLIIVYCDDESKSRAAAQMLIQKSYENTSLLSGGFYEFADRFPGFCTGDLPTPPTSRNIPGTGRSSRGSRSQFGAPQSTRSGGSSSGSITGRSMVSQRGPPQRNIPGTGRSVSSQRGGAGMGGYAQPTHQNMRMMGASPRLVRGDLDAVSEAGSCTSVAASVISRASQKKGAFLSRGRGR